MLVLLVHYQLNNTHEKFLLGVVLVIWDVQSHIHRCTNQIVWSYHICACSYIVCLEMHSYKDRIR